MTNSAAEATNEEFLVPDQVVHASDANPQSVCRLWCVRDKSFCTSGINVVVTTLALAFTQML